ncbi:doubtful CDS found within S. typhi pathogenicity island [Salmonella enterica subsp. arizonae]|nr:doubtful CDS found within S. typhi pathogenicity island [Salmonella enterica subsp. arizonae]
MAEIYDDIADNSRLIIKSKLRHVENDPKELLICVPTRSEWLFYWIKGDKHCARRRAYKNIKHYVSKIKPKIKIIK